MSTTRITDNDYADVALYDKVNTIANEIDNEVSQKANSSNTVTTNTAQTITAKKILTGDIVRSINIDVSQIPTTNTYILPFTVDNNDESVRAYQQVSYRTNGILQNSLGLRRTVNGTNIFNGIDLEIDINGNKSVNVITPPTTSNSANIATTAFVKSVLSSNGNGLATLISNDNGNAIKFTNGLIIQYGVSLKGNNVAITFPTPFSTSNIAITMNSVGSQTEQYARIVNQKSATGFTMAVAGGASGFGFNWMAVGI